MKRSLKKKRRIKKILGFSWGVGYIVESVTPKSTSIEQQHRMASGALKRTQHATTYLTPGGACRNARAQCLAVARTRRFYLDAGILGDFCS